MIGVWFVASLLFVSGHDQGVAAEQAWEVDPYRVSLWVVSETIPQFSSVRSPGGGDLSAEISRYCRALFGGAWELTELSQESRPSRAELRDLSQLSHDALVARAPTVAEFDKLITVVLRHGPSDQRRVTVEVREYDVPTQSWGPSYRRELVQRERFARDIGDLVVSSFRPVARLGTAKGTEISVRIRASRLTVNEASPLLVRPGDVLEPIRIEKDRNGKPLPGGIMPVAWTLLVVNAAADHVVNCEIASGLRYPLRGRTGFRRERIALLARPTSDLTRLRVHVRDRPDESIPGCTILDVDPETKKASLVGVTDWDGMVEVVATEDPVRILYVKYGDRVMARIPILPGWRALQSVPLVDDNVRLEAEGFVRGIQEQLIDLVVRRKVMAVRIRGRIDSERFEEAEQLLDQIRTLTSRDSLYRQLQERQQRYAADHRSAQALIDRLFRQTNSQLQEHLGDGLIDQLRSELAAGRRGEARAPAGPLAPAAEESGGDVETAGRADSVEGDSPESPP